MPRLSQHSILRYATAASMLDTQSRAVRALIKRDGKAAASAARPLAPAHGARSSHAHVCHDGDAPGRGYVSLRQTVPEHLLINSPNPHGFTKQRRKLNSISNPHQDQGPGPRAVQDRPPPMASPTQNAPHWRTAGRAGPSGSPRRTPKRREPPPTRLGPNRDSPLAPRCGKPDPVLDRVAHPYRRSRRCGSKPNRKALLPVPLEQLSGHGEQTGPSPGLGPPPGRPPSGDPAPERSRS